MVRICLNIFAFILLLSNAVGFCQDTVQMEIPRIKADETIIHHTAYSLSYNEEYEQANWVAYELTHNETIPVVERNNDFDPDPMVATQTADAEDYYKSGYDRGHLAASADMCWSEKTMDESFYYSNMSPQLPGFNRGIWKNCEALVRTWARKYDSIYIVTGPVLEKNLPTIGQNKVAIPNCYYKIALVINPNETKAIGFLIPNKKSSIPLVNFSVSIDSVEEVTGINFYPNLIDSIEEKVEQNIDTSLWVWEIDYSGNNNTSESTPAIQCKGVTKSGHPCKNKTHNSSGFCYLHEKQAEE